MGKFKDTCIHSVKRTGSVLAVLAPIAIIGFTIYTLAKKPSNRITVEKGGQFTQVNKTSRWYILFAELGVENQNNDLGFYTRLGMRLEF